jgi:hypothetical protein
MANNPKYNATPPTLADGQEGQLQIDENGNLKVSDGGSAAAVATATGEIDDVKVIDPDASGTVIALLKGILEALNEISTNTATP